MGSFKSSEICKQVCKVLNSVYEWMRERVCVRECCLFDLNESAAINGRHSGGNRATLPPANRIRIKFCMCERVSECVSKGYASKLTNVQDRESERTGVSEWKRATNTRIMCAGTSEQQCTFDTENGFYVWYMCRRVEWLLECFPTLVELERHNLNGCYC